MLENHTAAGDVEGSFFPPFPRHMFFLSLLSAPRQPRSICIRLLKEFCEGCLLLFSLRGPDCSEPQVAEKDSRSHLSLSARLLVSDMSVYTYGASLMSVNKP